MSIIDKMSMLSVEDATKAVHNLLSVKAVASLAPVPNVSEVKTFDLPEYAESVALVSELHKSTLASYVKKASVDAKFMGYRAGAQDADAVAHTKGTKGERLAAGADASVDLDDKAHKRLSNVAKAVDKIVKEDETVEE
jgi:hypothetical protein